MTATSLLVSVLGSSIADESTFVTSSPADAISMDENSTSENVSALGLGSTPSLDGVVLLSGVAGATTAPGKFQSSTLSSLEPAPASASMSAVAGSPSPSSPSSRLRSDISELARTTLLGLGVEREVEMDRERSLKRENVRDKLRLVVTEEGVGVCERGAGDVELARIGESATVREDGGRTGGSGGAREACLGVVDRGGGGVAVTGLEERACD